MLGMIVIISNGLVYVILKQWGPVVFRRKMAAHFHEPFWYIRVKYCGGLRPFVFTWDRERMFNRDVAAVLCEACMDDPVAHVLSVRIP